jgi:hypothetical protein
MAKEEGYLLMFRSLFKHQFWVEKRVFSKFEAWVDLIRTANYKEKKILVKSSMVGLQRGQIAVSLRDLAKKWSWSKNKVARFLMLLEYEQMIRIQKRNDVSIITLNNYSYYNNFEEAEEKGTKESKLNVIYYNEFTEKSARIRPIREETEDIDGTPNGTPNEAVNNDKTITYKDDVLETGHQTGHRRDRVCSKNGTANGTANGTPNEAISNDKIITYKDDVWETGHQTGHQTGHKRDTDEDIYINNINKENNICIYSKKQNLKSYYAEEVTLTEQEYRKLIMRYGEEKTLKAIEKLNGYKISKGKKYKSDYGAILNWVIQAVIEQELKEKKYESNRRNNSSRGRGEVTQQQIDEIRSVFMPPKDGTETLPGITDKGIGGVI